MGGRGTHVPPPRLRDTTADNPSDQFKHRKFLTRGANRSIVLRHNVDARKCKSRTRTCKHASRLSINRVYTLPPPFEPRLFLYLPIAQPSPAPSTNVAIGGTKPITANSHKTTPNDGSLSHHHGRRPCPLHRGARESRSYEVMNTVTSQMADTSIHKRRNPLSQFIASPRRTARAPSRARSGKSNPAARACKRLSRRPGHVLAPARPDRVDAMHGRLRRGDDLAPARRWRSDPNARNRAFGQVGAPAVPSGG
jgi:hypothetical protein